MIRALPTTFALLLGISAQAHCETFGNIEVSAAERRACAPDLVKYCRDSLPDVNRVLACMQAKRAQLSPACDRVVASRGF